MAVCPGGVFAQRGSRIIKQAGLGENHERTVGVLAIASGFFRRGDLLEAAAEVHGSGAGAIACLPWDRRRKRVVHFECAGSIAKFLKLSDVCPCEAASRNPQKLARSYVEKNGVILRQ